MFNDLVRRAGWLALAAISLLFILAGCVRTESGEIDSITSPPTRTLAPATATPSTLPAAGSTPTPTDLPAPATLAAITVSEEPATTDSLIPESARRLIEEITGELVAEHHLAPAEVQLVSLERFNWADESWGCTAHPPNTTTSPGSGYRLLFSTGSRIYVYHTDENETFFPCSDRDWLALEGKPLPLDPIAQSMVDLSIHDAAKRLDVPADELRLTSLLAIGWPDSSIGCPKPGATYADQLTTGYRIVLRTDTATLVYHTSIRHTVKCDPAEEILPGFVRRALPDPTPTPTPETPA